MAGRIKYDVIRANQAQEVSDFLINNFFPNEPISRAFGLPQDQVTRWFPSQIGECLKPEISVCAVDTSTGELVGAAINIIAEKDLKNSDKHEGRGLLDILDPEKEAVMVEIAKFLGVLNQLPDEVYRKSSKNDSFKTFNCIYFAVLPSYGGSGIGKRLIEESEKLARKLPVTFLQVDTTSEFSYRIFNRCGYVVVRELDMHGIVPRINEIDNGVHKKGRILLKTL